MGSVPIFVAILAAIAIGFPVLMYLVQDRLLFFPQPLAESRRAEIGKRFPGVEEVFIDAENHKLHAWHIRGNPLVIYFGGNAEEVSWMIEEARTRTPGVGWLLVSYRGYGASEGSPSEASISADALRWYDFIVEREKPREVVVFGRSLGSGAAVFLAANRTLSSVILVTPFDSLVAVAKHHYPMLPVSWMLKHRFDSAARAPAIEAPLLCIAASRDEVIPALHARKLYDAWGGKKRWIEIEGAGHNSTDGAPIFWQSIGAFLEKSSL
jgi:pimeloyl-ACP methyl ester carboxylesterase